MMKLPRVSSHVITIVYLVSFIVNLVINSRRQTHNNTSTCQLHDECKSNVIMMTFLPKELYSRLFI